MFILLWTGSLNAEQIDIGIFESSIPGRFDIKIKPDFVIQANQAITAIRYTLRWSDADISLNNHRISPFNLSPVGSPQYHNGYHYQIFLALPLSPVGTAIEAGEERTIASFSFDGDYCDTFEVIADEWTSENLGNPILELQGTIRTGIIYEGTVDLKPQGGFVDGGGQIELGEDSGPLILSDFDGEIAGWQRKLNVNQWEEIPGTEGVLEYNEEPASFGNWRYRAVITKPDCDPAFSEPALVQVFEPGINIVLQHLGNGLFEVRLRPHINIETGISNIQFAIQWPAESVQLTDFTYDLDIEHQFTVQHDEYQYASFVAVPEENQELNWLAGEEYLIMAFAHDESGNGTADFVIADNQWSTDNHSQYYVEWWGQDITGLISNQAFDVFTGIGRSLDIHVMLEGPYEVEKGLMRTRLNELNLIPSNHPYAAEPWSHQGSEEFESLDVDVVDWMLIELIDAENVVQALSASPILTKALLLKSDGRLVNHRMKTPSVELEQGVEHGIFIIIRHRNHLDILSSEALLPDPQNRILFRDFRQGLETVFGGAIGYKQIDDSMYGMVAGDNDKDGVISALDFNLWRRDAGTESVYNNSDFNFMGIVSALDFNIWRRNAGIASPF